MRIGGAEVEYDILNTYLRRIVKDIEVAVTGKLRCQRVRVLPSFIDMFVEIDRCRSGLVEISRIKALQVLLGREC